MLLTYVYRRTHLPTYAISRRAYPTDVRQSAMYVFGITLLQNEDFGTTHSEIKIRDYAVGSRGVGTTQNFLDLVEEDRRLVFRP